MKIICPYCNGYMTEYQNNSNNIYCHNCYYNRGILNYLTKDGILYAFYIVIDNVRYKILSPTNIVTTELVEYDDLDIKNLDHYQIVSTANRFHLNINEDLKPQIIKIVSKLLKLIPFQ